MQFHQEFVVDVDRDHLESFGDEAEAVSEWLEDLADSPDHRLLTVPAEIQGDMRVECHVASQGVNFGHVDEADATRAKTLEGSPADWQLLLQIDSDDEWMWGDAGRLYFWIRNQDLAKRDFSRTWVVLQCY